VHFDAVGDRFTDVFLEGDARVIYRGDLWEEAWLS
jgi:diaminopimelate epimerase